MPSAKRRSAPADGEETRKKRSRSSDATTAFVSLETFISNIFYDVFIQDQEDIFKITLNRNWAQDVEETNNGAPLNFRMFRDFVAAQREAISNRQLISQSFVVAPADQEGKTGAVAHTSVFSGIQQGKEVKGTIVSVLKVSWSEKENRRQVETENFVFAFL